MAGQRPVEEDTVAGAAVFSPTSSSLLVSQALV